MSNVVSALNGATYQGFATITDMGPRGMITLRGDLTAAKLKKAVKSVTGCDMPGVRAITIADSTSIAWMSPDEALVLCAYDEARNMAAKLTEALAGQHHLVANVSDARALFAVSGTDSREVLAKLTPADLSGIKPGAFRRSRLAQVPAAFWMPDEGTFHVICFRSVAQYVFDILKSSAIPGSEVGYD